MSTLPNDVAPETVPDEVDVAAMDDAALDVALKGPVEEEPAETPETPVDEKPKFVPHAALHEERVKRQAIEAQFREQQNTLNQIMARFNAAEQAKAEAEAPKPPSLDEDPIGAMMHKLEAVEGALTYQQQQQQAQQQQAALSNFVQRDQQQFAAQTPDFESALTFLAQSRQAELAAAGYGPNEIAQAINYDTWAIVQRAAQMGTSPAATLYQMSQARGYAPAQNDTASKLATIAKGQETTRTAGAGKARAQLTPADLLNMSDADFDKHFERVMKGQ